MIRVLVADDEALVRGGISMILEAQPDMEVVGEAADGAEAMRLCRELAPDVALLDIRMPGTTGIDATRQIIGHGGRPVRVLILTTFDDDEYVFTGLRAGAKGYLLKDTPSEELVAAIEKASRGEAVLGGSITLKVISELRRPRDPAADPQNPDALSERELEVLKLIGSGASNREIAQTLYITEGTTKNHISKILRKLGLRDRT